MHQIIKDSLDNSINYTHYYRLIQKLVSDKFTTGDNISEENINYTMLNERRMRRWNKKLVITEEDKAKIMKFSSEVIWLVISESWCGDAAHLIPVMNKVAELNKNINLKIVLRDDNKDLMNQFLTNGSESIPKLIMLDAKSLETIDTYGSRPSIANEMVKDFKKEYGKLTNEFKEDLQRWYNKDKGKTTIEDLTELLEKHTPSFSL